MDTPFSRFCSFVITMLIVVGLVVVLVQGVANGNSGAGYADASGSPNVVTGGLTAVGSGIGSASQSLSTSINNSSHAFATDTAKASRSVASTVNTAAMMVGSTVNRGTRFAVTTSVRTTAFAITSSLRAVSFAAHATVRTTGFAVTSTRHSVQLLTATDLTTLRLVGGTVWNGEAMMGHTSLAGLAFVAHSTSQLSRVVSGTSVMASVLRPTDTGKVPVIHAVAYAPVSFAKPAPKAAPPAPQPAPAPAAPQLPVAAVTTATDRSLSAAKANDLYAWGNCTWWVFIRRYEVGDPIPNTWGNATNWADAAAADGYVVDHHPTPGSIMQISGVDYGLGHVAYVESVDSDGTWHISEMNVVGLDAVDNKAEPASAAANYRFIHDAN